MARRKGTGIPGLSFSWRRALGISQAQARLSRQIGIPLSKSGRQRKFGAAAGCMMPILIVLFFVLMLALFAAGCGSSESEFTINLYGTDGLSVEGVYMITDANGSSVSKSVAIKLPHQIKLKGNIISVNFQKMDEQGTLKMDVFKNNNLSQSVSTSAPYGVVSIATK